MREDQGKHFLPVKFCDREVLLIAKSCVAGKFCGNENFVPAENFAIEKFYEREKFCNRENLWQ